MNIAHLIKKPLYWCARCELSLHSHEVDEVRLPNELGFAGTDQYLTICGACGNEALDYNFQDEQEEDEIVDLVELLNLHAATQRFKKAEQANDLDSMLCHFCSMLHWHRAIKAKRAVL